jgi:hypothetical protein
LRAEALSCRLDVLYEGLGISKLRFLIKKDFLKFSSCFFEFLVIETLDPDPDSLEMLDHNPDPQSWFFENFT